MRTGGIVDYVEGLEGQGRSGGGKKRSASQIWLAVRVICISLLLVLFVSYLSRSFMNYIAVRRGCE